MARRVQTKVNSSKNEAAGKDLLVDTLRGKTVIADTSALLIRGTDLLRSLPDCRFIIPTIVVKELEGKRTSPNVGFLARDWLRLLEALRVNHETKLAEGVPVPSDFTSKEIVISIEPNHTNQSNLPQSLKDGSNDSVILAVASNFNAEEEHSGKVELLSNDVPMRLHATLELGIPAHEISFVTIDAAKPFTGRIEVEVEDEDVDSVFGKRERSSLAVSDIISESTGDGISHALVDLSHGGEVLETVLYSREKGVTDLPRSKNRAKGISPKTVEQRVAMDYLLRSVKDLPIVSVAGGAGTGKTLLTIAAGLEGVKQNNYQKVLVFRSLHEMGAGQEMGFLPGNVDEKIAPWSGAVMDSLEVIARASKRGEQKPTKADVAELKVDVEVSPISYLRGRSITDTFMVLDEAQNFSRNELLNIISRAGEGTKIVLLADPAQVDNRFLQTGPRAEVWSVINSLKSSELFAHVTLVSTERSKVAELASKILAQ